MCFFVLFYIPIYNIYIGGKNNIYIDIGKRRPYDKNKFIILSKA